MAKVLIGNFKGSKGDAGATGQQGEQGKTGVTGQRGSRWTEGTAITGTSTTATVFGNSGITDALVNDHYLNTTTGNVYRCTTAGVASVAKWVFAGCLKGAKGDAGETGATGATGAQGPKGDTGKQGPRGATGASGTADTTFTEATSLAKLTSGESFKTMLGKMAKAVSTLFNKLDKTSVVNNQTTTVAGYALDAVQANPNVDGTLGAQIAALNSNLSANPISKYFKVSFNVENDSIKNRIFSLQDSGFKCGVFWSNNSCKDNPQTISWYNIFWFGMSSEAVIIAGATWEQFLYYGTCNNAEEFRDKDIIWKKLSTN